MDLTDTLLRSILKRSHVIALVGASPKPERPSHRVMGFLLSVGYRVIPVNPGLAGQQIHGQRVYGSLEEVARDMGTEVDMIDIFRKSEAVPEVVETALEVFPNLGTVWMQLGVISDTAASMAQAKGVDVVMDRCPAIEYPRLFEV